MSYSAAVDGLFALAGELHTAPGGARRKFELAAMRVLVEALGSPHLRFPSVLIAGTNGKGSTAATLASILRVAGYHVGLYTSPHLSRVNERIRSNGQDISDSDFAAAYFRVDDCARRLVAEGRLAWHPSFFETMTALAFLYFAERKVQIAILEVGMGGRLDATNIVEPLVSVITDISLDHMEWLGNTITKIAREKAGILRQNGVLVTLPQHPEANQSIGEAAVALNVRGVNAADYVPARSEESGAYDLTVLGERIEVASPLAGAHQQRNIALAIATAVELCNRHGYKITARQIAEGIHETRWPGRLECFSRSGRADVLMDVAHNPAGAWALRSALSHLNPEPRIMTAVFGCLRDKAFPEMAQILFPMFETVVLTEVPSPRTASLDGLTKAAAVTGVQVLTASSPKDALAQAIAKTPPDGAIIVTGSVFLVGELRSLLAEART
ncbi:MAG: bifunctional folylpolyglutamate synthase/dihydrofolate synthase [Acidobacteriaceae bacterium]